MSWRNCSELHEWGEGHELAQGERWDHAEGMDSLRPWRYKCTICAFRKWYTDCSLQGNSQKQSWCHRGENSRDFPLICYALAIHSQFLNTRGNIIKIAFAFTISPTTHVGYIWAFKASRKVKGEFLSKTYLLSNKWFSGVWCSLRS